MTYYKYFLAFLIIINLSLNSCSSKTDSPKESAKPCITDKFTQEQMINLYGKKCLQGKHLVIQASEEGTVIDTSDSISKARLEGSLDFINKVYSLSYNILENKEDDKIIFLRDLLPKNIKLHGSRNRKYHIIFEIDNNYLILYKASKKLDDIPFTERTAMEKTKDGEYKKAETGYYMVPFFGYPITYCRPVSTDNSQSNTCKLANPKNAKYIRVIKGKGQPYEYLKEKDLLPSSHFEGEWFFVEGSAEHSNWINDEIPLLPIKLIKFQKTLNSLEVVDAEEGKSWSSLHVEWKNYRMDRTRNTIHAFREVPYNRDDGIMRPYIKINKPYYIHSPVRKSAEADVEFEKTKLTDDNSKIIDFLIAENYVSIMLQITDKDRTFKYRYAFFKKPFAGEKEEGFLPRKWFKEINDHHFGVLAAKPKNITQKKDFTDEEILNSHRMIHFNINKQKTTEIKWFFSKNSTIDPYYRGLARRAVQIYNQAFQTITRGTNKTVTVKLMEDEGDKDIGDPRYNIINIVEEANISDLSPLYVNSKTGQIISSAANVIINSILEEIYQNIRMYIRHEIFQKGRGDNKDHVLNDYAISEIQTKCGSAIKFIREQKNKFAKGLITPRSHLNDKKAIDSCIKDISRDRILSALLHQMGHGFGLGHNFRASIDRANHYQSVEEIRQYFPNINFSKLQKTAKSSSVMDALPALITNNMTVLGKYDLAVLRFLYMDQLETAKGELLSLNTPKEPDQQKPIGSKIISQIKAYKYCSDEKKEQRLDLLCKTNDYGSSPLELVKYYIQTAKHYFNSKRYRYDGSDLDLVSSPLFVEKIYSDFETLMALYDSPSPNNSKKEETRIPIYDFVTDFLFLETMKCEIKDKKGKKYSIDLELIKKHLLPLNNGDLYVKDCHSKAITNFFDKEELTLIGQRGIENFESRSYYTKQEPEQECEFINAKGETRLISPIEIEISELNDLINLYNNNKAQNISESMKQQIIESIKQQIAELEKEQTLLREDPQTTKETCHSENIKKILIDKGLKIKGRDVISLRDFLRDFPTENFLNFIAKEPHLYIDLLSKLKEYISNRDDISQTDLKKITKIYNLLFNQVGLTVFQLVNEEDKQNLNKYRSLHSSVFFHIGEEDTFYNNVQKFLDEGVKIEDIITNPFIDTVYRQYIEAKDKDENQVKDFQNCPDSFQDCDAVWRPKKFQEYLMGLDTTIVLYKNNNPNGFITPAFSNSFPERLIQKYNKNLKRIRSLDKLERKLTLLEAMERERREMHNTFLLELIKTVYHSVDK